ncbi:MAG: hypothetical protein ACIPMY_06920 [Rickettsia endosymbiont of Pentastiridius leporinus]
MLGLIKFFQRSTISLNQISSWGKKLLNIYTSIINAPKNTYSVSSENEAKLISGVADDSTPLVKLNHIFQKVYEHYFSKREVLYKSKSLESLCSLSSDSYIKEIMLVTEQEIHKRNGIELSSSKSIKGKENEAILNVESTNDNMPPLIDDSSYRLIILNSESKEIITSKKELKYYLSPNGEYKNLVFNESSTITYEEVENLGEMLKVSVTTL